MGDGGLGAGGSAWGRGVSCGRSRPRARGLRSGGRRPHAGAAVFAPSVREGGRRATARPALDDGAGDRFQGSARGPGGEAGVSEPILYRHFGSKRDLYLACLDEAWARGARLVGAQALADEPERRAVAAAMGTAYMNLREKKAALADFWIQALTEAGGDPEIRRYLKRHLREVHDFVADVIGRAQAAGGVPAERDPAAEAWIFIALAVLGSFGRRLGGLLTPEDFGGIVASRRAWMTGKK